MAATSPPIAATDVLNIALTVEKTEAEGPGARFAIWVQGCPFRCSGCCNPHMLVERVRDLVKTDDVISQIRSADVEGISLLGGEPFAQAAALAQVAAATQAAGKSVMIFSGYRLEELHELKSPAVDALLQATDLLVDDRYDETKRTLNRRWIGSENQTMHFLSDFYDAADPRFSASNTVELRLTGSTLTLNGWPVTGRDTFPVQRKRSKPGDV